MGCGQSWGRQSSGPRAHCWLPLQVAARCWGVDTPCVAHLPQIPRYNGEEVTPPSSVFVLAAAFVPIAAHRRCSLQPWEHWVGRGRSTPRRQILLLGPVVAVGLGCSGLCPFAPEHGLEQIPVLSQRPHGETRAGLASCSDIWGRGLGQAGGTLPAARLHAVLHGVVCASASSLALCWRYHLPSAPPSHPCALYQDGGTLTPSPSQ